MSTVLTTGLGMIGRAPKVSGLKKPRPLRRQMSSPDRQTDMKAPFPTRSISVPTDSLDEEFLKLTIRTDSANDNEMLGSNNPDTNMETVTECNNNVLKQSLHYTQVSSRRSSTNSTASDSSALHRPTISSYPDNINNVHCDNSSHQATPLQRFIFMNSSNISSKIDIPAFSRQSSTSSSSSEPQESQQLNSGNVLQYVYNTSDGKIVREKSNSLTNGETEESETLRDNSEDADKASEVTRNAQTSSNSVIASKAETFCSSSNESVKSMWASAQQTHRARLQEMQTKLGCLKQPDPLLLQKQIELSRADFYEADNVKETPDNAGSRSSNDSELGPSYTSIINVEGEKLVLASRCLKTLMKAANKICQMKGTHMIKVESTEVSEPQPPRKTKMSVPKQEKRFAPIQTGRPQNVGQGDGFSIGNGMLEYNEQKFAWQILEDEFDANLLNNRENSCYRQESPFVEYLRLYSEKKLLSLSTSHMSRVHPKNWHTIHCAFPEICLLNLEGIYFDPFDLKACRPEAVMAHQPGAHRGLAQPPTPSSGFSGWPASRNFLSLNKSNNNADDEQVEVQVEKQVDEQ